MRPWPVRSRPLLVSTGLPRAAAAAWHSKKIPLGERDPIFEEHRQDLARTGLRLLLAHDDDVLQEAYLRWSRQDCALQLLRRRGRTLLGLVVTRSRIHQRLVIVKLARRPMSHALRVVERGRSLRIASQCAELAESLSLAFLIALQLTADSAGSGAAYSLSRCLTSDTVKWPPFSTSCRQLPELVNRMHSARGDLDSRPNRMSGRADHGVSRGLASGELNRLAGIPAGVRRRRSIRTAGAGKVSRPWPRFAPRLVGLGVLRVIASGPAISPVAAPNGCLGRRCLGNQVFNVVTLDVMTVASLLVTRPFCNPINCRDRTRCRGHAEIG